MNRCITIRGKLKEPVRASPLRTIGTKQELEAWYEELERVQREFSARFPDLDYPHEV